LNDTIALKDWLGRTRRNADGITLGAVQRLAATLDQDSTAFRRGSELPESWYAILFAPIAPKATAASWLEIACRRCMAPDRRW
jgi:hypothetical protein